MTEINQFKGHDRIKLQGRLMLDSKLDNVDYYIKDELGKEDNLTDILKDLTGLRKKVNMKLTSQFSSITSQGILKYIEKPTGIKGFYILEYQIAYFDLDSVLWSLTSTNEEITIEIDIINDTREVETK